MVCLEQLMFIAMSERRAVERMVLFVGIFMGDCGNGLFGWF